jgi:hypothetical protein
MNSSKSLICGLLLIASVFGLAKAAEYSDVVSISIDIESSGLPGDHSDFHERITNKGGVFVTKTGAAISPASVSALLAALRRKPRERPDVADLGLTKASLAASASKAFQVFLFSDVGHGEGFYTPEQRALFLRSYSDPAVVSYALDRSFHQSRPCDDDVDITVKIELQNGQAVHLETDQPSLGMLPWRVERGNVKYATFELAIGNAVRALVPEETLETVLRPDRLRRDKLIAALPTIVGAAISPQWDRLRKYDLASVVAPIEKKYSVRISHGGSETTSDAGLAWNADLSWPDLPNSFVATVTLPIVSNTILNQKSIPAARRFADEVFALPWVRNVSKRPETKVRVLIENGDGSQISNDTRTRFLSDLRKIGRLDLADKMAPLMDRAFVVMFEEPKTFSQWVVLPDRTAVLWDYYDAHPTNSILDISATQLNGKPCSNDELCSGIVRRPDGTIGNDTSGKM